MTTPPPARARSTPVTWSWPHALVGVAFALPALVVTLIDPGLGVPLAVGVLPAAMLGIPARRRDRRAILAVGVLAGLAMFVGGILAHLPIYLAAALLLTCVVGAALLAATIAAGRLMLSLCAPLVGAGLSYDDWGTSAATLGLLIVGACYAWLVSLLWPSHAAPARPPQPMPSRRPMLDYGVRMGSAAAIVYLIADSLGLDHPGWAPAACLLVARPQLDLLQRRGVGRVLSVLVGALAAALLLMATPSKATLALVAVVALAATAATAGSRWYVTSTFTTLLVVVMLLYGHPEAATATIDQRVGETILGVAAAYLFGWALPVLRQRFTPTDQTSERT